MPHETCEEYIANMNNLDVISWSEIKLVNMSACKGKLPPSKVRCDEKQKEYIEINRLKVITG